MELRARLFGWIMLSPAGVSLRAFKALGINAEQRAKAAKAVMMPCQST